MNRLKSLPPIDPVWFWEHVEVSDEGACWPWKHYAKPTGYGVFTKKGIGYRAHRVALWFSSGEDYPDLLACHSCDNPRCCNPSHLYWGTQKQNMKDRSTRGRGPDLRGTKNPRAKLDAEKVSEIRRLAESKTVTELARQFDVDRKAIYMIIKNTTWKEIADESC